MPPFTAILHTLNDAARLGRALESLRPCDEILVVDHGSVDATLRVACEYGATIQRAAENKTPAACLAAASYHWVLCVLPSEALTEELEASLFEWKLCPAEQVRELASCSMVVRVETPTGWVTQNASTRLVPRHWAAWDGTLPRASQAGKLLPGKLLRFRAP
jgi:hypothetical protein